MMRLQQFKATYKDGARMDSKLLFERAPLTKLLSVALAILDQDVSVARKKLGIHQNKSDCNLMTDRDVQGGVSDEKAATVLFSVLSR